MNFLNKILLSVFLLLFCFLVVRGGQAYSADGLILQDLDIQNNLAIICQDGGSLCSDVEFVVFDDLEMDQKDQVIEMIASSFMDEYSYNSSLDLDQFSNFLSHSDKISYSHYYDSEMTALILVAGSTGTLLTSVMLLRLFPQFKHIFFNTGLVGVSGNLLGGLIFILIYAFEYLDIN